MKRSSLVSAFLGAVILGSVAWDYLAVLPAPPTVDIRDFSVSSSDAEHIPPTSPPELPSYSNDGLSTSPRENHETENSPQQEDKDSPANSASESRREIVNTQDEVVVLPELPAREPSCPACNCNCSGPDNWQNQVFTIVGIVLLGPMANEVVSPRLRAISRNQRKDQN